VGTTPAAAVGSQVRIGPAYAAQRGRRGRAGAKRPGICSAVRPELHHRPRPVPRPPLTVP
jgi:hypothetical protein